MITVYGADWCEDTRRARRHLRRLAVPHRYINIDEDLDALERAKRLNHGKRRTPTIDLGVGGPALIEPENDTLTGALVELEMLTGDEARERLAVQNIGDLERVGRTAAGLLLAAAALRAGRAVKWPLALLGGIAAASGVTGWCPAYHLAGVTSLDGPADRPDEATRRGWLAPRTGMSPPVKALRESAR